MVLKMSAKFHVLLVVVIAGAIYIQIFIKKPIIEMCEKERCPYCYGTSLCEAFELNLIKLEFSTFAELFYNLVSVKNVFFASFNGEKVVLKKLGHDSELKNVIKLEDSAVETIENFLDSSSTGDIKSFKSCSRKVSKQFIAQTLETFTIEQIWTTLQINAEPLILTIFRNEDGWPVPKFYGTCGILAVENHCGPTLNYFGDADWHKRAFLAIQLLEAAQNFTENHNAFRLYLTDISPDNVAVDEDWKVHFVDLENTILASKENSPGSSHVSEFFAGDDFVYSENGICSNSISDHNVYAVCRLLLSKYAPPPMMKSGLLHSAPESVLSSHSELFDLVESCAHARAENNRFELAQKIVRILNHVRV